MKPILILTVILSFFCLSCEEILMEEDISDSAIQLLAPTSNAVVKVSTIIFQWAEVDGATSYQIQIAYPGFGNAEQIIINTEVEVNMFTHHLPVGEYEWRVRAINSEYTTNYTLSNFHVESNENFSSNQLILLSPQDDLITNETTQDLEWQEVNGATFYRIQILKNNILVDEITSADPNIEIRFPQGDLKWRIRAENDTQNTFYSERNILVDTLSPNIPNLINPKNETNLNSPSITFEWERAEIPGSSETDSLYIYQRVDLDELVEKGRVINSYIRLSIEIKLITG